MDTISTLRAERVRKMEELRAAHVEPYSNDFRPTLTAEDARHAPFAANEDALRAAMASNQEDTHVVAGRVLTIRDAGKALFCTIQDRTGLLQLYLKVDFLGEEGLAFFKRSIDLGDIIGASGALFQTRVQARHEAEGKGHDVTLLVGATKPVKVDGQGTPFASALRLLTKSLRPLPDKWHGLTDVEQRYRQRYVDLVVNPQARETLRRRSRVVAGIRKFLDSRDFVEVETPILQESAGGATARPFVTRYNVLNQDMYLRIATELHLKRLVVGGIERVYEIGRIFRNEGLSRKHNPEFTTIELYQAYATYRDLMDLTEEMLCQLATEVLHADRFTYQGKEVRLTRPFKRVTLGDLVGSHLGRGDQSGIRDVTAGLEMALGHTVTTAEPLNLLCKALKAEQVRAILPDGARFFRDHGEALAPRKALEAAGGNVTDFYRRLGEAADRELPAEVRRDIALYLLFAVFEHEIEHTLLAPTFVTDYPISASPLARRKDGDPAVVDRFELFCAGMEVANAFSELTDPLDQRGRFEAQLRMKAMGDDEAQPLDEDFLTALEVGMPPTAGEGIGIDRLCMLLTDSATIREVIAFPQLRRVEEQGPATEPPAE
jgi:lysyl-tRNA synthetase class 2